MTKPNLSKMIKSMKIALKQHSPEILTGIGIAGMITTTVLAVKATPKAIILLEDAKNEAEGFELTPIETVKVAWKCYIPSAVIGSISVVCLICANSVNAQHNAALAAAYTLSEATLKEYQEKVVETIGEKKENAIRDSIAKDRVDKSPASNSEVYITPNGNTLCYDTISGRYFKSDKDRIKKAENEINRRMLSENDVSLNDFYSEIGLSETIMGDELGWDINKTGYIDLYFSSILAENDTPCLVIDYGRNPPRYDYLM